MTDNLITITEHWVHADACPFIVTAQCGCGHTATLCRVRCVRGNVLDTELFCDDCVPVVRVYPYRAPIDESKYVTSCTALAPLDLLTGSAL